MRIYATFATSLAAKLPAGVANVRFGDILFVLLIYGVDDG